MKRVPSAFSLIDAVAYVSLCAAAQTCKVHASSGIHSLTVLWINIPTPFGKATLDACPPFINR